MTAISTRLSCTWVCTKSSVGKFQLYRVQKCHVIKLVFFFFFWHFLDHISVAHDENLHTPNLTWIGSSWPEIRLHEYLISPIESLVQNSYEPGQFTLISMGLRRYSCDHILAPMNIFSPNLGHDVFHHAPSKKKKRKKERKKKKRKKMWHHHFCTQLLPQPLMTAISIR